jgi:hypothetical protein
MSRVQGPRGHKLETPHPCQPAARPGTRMQETDHVQMTRICRGNPKGPNGMFCRTVPNGAVQRVNIFQRHSIMACMLDAVSGSAELGSTSEQRVEEHNPQPYRVGFQQGQPHELRTYVQGRSESWSRLGIPHRFTTTEALRECNSAYYGSPNPCYNEYICYPHVSTPRVN